MEDTRSLLDTTVTVATDDNDDYEIVLVKKSRRVGHLLPSAKCVLVYLSLWQLLLIACNLLLVGTSAFRKRPHLILPSRPFYWFYLYFTVALIAWLYGSITVLFRRQDNLRLFSNLGFSVLVLLLIDTIFLSRLFVGFAVTSEINGSLLQILTDSEALHHCLLFASRIVCFILWTFFLNGQLSHTKWTPLQTIRKISLRSLDFTQIFNDIDF